jgi:hypothetical protein
MNQSTIKTQKRSPIDIYLAPACLAKPLADMSPPRVRTGPFVPVLSPLGAVAVEDGRGAGFTVGGTGLDIFGPIDGPFMRVAPFASWLEKSKFTPTGFDGFHATAETFRQHYVCHALVHRLGQARVARRGPVPIGACEGHY